MNNYIALLRGINVGGGKTILPMEELRSICSEIGLEKVRTYIQSGNVIFESDLTEPLAIKKLEDALFSAKERQIHVIVRTSDEIQSILDNNPFPDANPARVGVMFFTDPVPENLLNGFSYPGTEEVIPSNREIYIHYPDGMGKSKLKLPNEKLGTVRNMNTVSKLVDLSKAE